MLLLKQILEAVFYGDNRDCDDHEYEQVHKMKFSRLIAKKMIRFRPLGTGFILVLKTLEF